MRGCSGGGPAWLVPGGVCMVLARGGVCVVFPEGGHAWFLWGGGEVCVWFLPGGCMVFAGGHAWFFPGGCMVFARQGGAWFFWGACMVFPGRGGLWCVRRIRRDTVNERAVRILLECILVLVLFFVVIFPCLFMT